MIKKSSDFLKRKLKTLRQDELKNHLIKEAIRRERELTGLRNTPRQEKQIANYKQKFIAQGEGNQLSADTPEHIIILIHGILTRAEWMDEVKLVLRNGDKNVVYKTKYGWFNLPRFLAPKNWLKGKAIKEVHDQLLAANELHPDVPISIIAHSFGTYILSQILQLKDPGLKINKLILCGCIMREDFDWRHIFTNCDNGLTQRNQVFNEFGKHDPWPRRASFHPNYGASGTRGFNNGIYVESRSHNIAHDGLLSASAAELIWLPMFS